MRTFLTMVFAFGLLSSGFVACSDDPPPPDQQAQAQGEQGSAAQPAPSAPGSANSQAIHDLTFALDQAKLDAENCKQELARLRQANTKLLADYDLRLATCRTMVETCTKGPAPESIAAPVDIAEHNRSLEGRPQPCSPAPSGQQPGPAPEATPPSDTPAPAQPAVDKAPAPAPAN